MTRTEYRQACRLIRDNGRAAIKWMAPHVAAAMDVLTFGQGKDRLAGARDTWSIAAARGHRLQPPPNRLTARIQERTHP